MVKKILCGMLIVIVGGSIGCGIREKEKNSSAVLEEKKDEIIELKLEKKIKNVKDIFENKTDFIFEAQLSEYEFLISIPNKSEIEYEKKIEGFSDTLYKYNIKTKEFGEYLKATNKDYIINRAYIFDKEWLVWIESDVLIYVGDETVGGNYNIVCRNIKNEETFFVEKKKNSSVDSFNIKMLINPQKISYSKDKIAYSYFEILDGKYQKCYKTFDLRNKEGKLHFKGENYFERTLSEIFILDDMITFTEADYEDKNRVKGEKNISKLYYFNINEEPKVFKEFTEFWRLGNPVIKENKIYTSNILYNTKETVDTTIVYEHNIDSKESKTIISAEKFKDKIHPLAYLGDMTIIENNLSFNGSVGGWILYNIKTDKIVELYQNDLFKNKGELLVVNYDIYDEYIHVTALDESKNSAIKYLIKYE